ncbi:MAG: iron ABC transporter permease, partial [Anaerolineae bacterium]|nr:iron ABC transporter permease [Anaerolineae bacterium]
MNTDPGDLDRAINMCSSRNFALLAGLALLLVLAFALSLSLGSVSIPLHEVALILGGGKGTQPAWQQIVWLFRVPKALTALLAGAALGIAGLEMQTLFRNPLADPYVLGVSSGASLGVALVVLGASGLLTGSTLLQGVGLLGSMGVVAAASLGAGLVMLLVLGIGQRVGTTILLILGLMIGAAVSALVTILLNFSIAERIQVYIAWTFGSFSATTWQELAVFAPVMLAGLTLTGLMSKPLNALLLGEDYARSMGVNIRQVRTLAIASASLLAGAVTAFCGPIGFIGIAVPHICRRIARTTDHRVLVPATVLTGGIVALCADII